MPRGGSKKAGEARLTPVQQGWLQHLRAAQRSGGTLKEYATRQGVAVQSLYQATKRLRHQGVIEPCSRRRKKTAANPFVRVEPTATRRETGLAWRIRLPSGVVFESSAPLAPEALVSLLTALAAPR